MSLLHWPPVDVLIVDDACVAAFAVSGRHGWRHCCQPLQQGTSAYHSVRPDLSVQVLMPCMVAASCAVPLAIWLRRDMFLHYREPLLAFKVSVLGLRCLSTAAAECRASVAPH